MSQLDEQIMEDLKTAMRAKDSDTLSVLRGLKSAMKNAAIEKGGADAELDEVEALAVVRKQVKQCQDSAEAFKGERPELEAKELAEIEVLGKYLPAALSADALAALVDEAIAESGASTKKDMGKVMGVLQAKVAGRADNKAISQAVMAKLN